MENITLVARICHEVNKVLCESVGDTSQLTWDESPSWQQASTLSGVDAVLKDPSITPEALHDKWSAYKVADGWVYGDVKDADKKTHPCLIPYSQLPKSQQLKDHTFQAIVRSAMAEGFINKED